jgi:hypothetical protein
MKFFLFFLLLPLASPAQTVLQVVTKNIRKTVPCKPGATLLIHSEKAEIEVLPGTGPTVTVEAELSARHPSLDSARADLEAWKLVVDASGGKIVVRAYIGVDAKAPLPVSGLKAKLRITAPADCPVRLSNSFGKAHLEKRSGPVVLQGEFCAFQLEELDGTVELESRYGKVEGRQLSGPVSMQVKRADIELSGIANSCAVKSEYGQVALETSRRTGAVTLQGEKSDIRITTTDPAAHNFEVKTTHGDLKLRHPMPFTISQPDKNTRQALLQRDQSLPLVKIVAHFGSVDIR